MDHNHVNGWDAAAVGVLIGVMVNMLPTVATLLTIVWMIIRIIETDTWRAWRQRRKSRRRPVVGGEDDADPV